MSSIHVHIIVEGTTEQTFVRDVLAPALSFKNVFLYPSLLGKPGHKGGNVRFDRAKTDIRNFLVQRRDTYITTMLDYFRIDSEWPGFDQIQQQTGSGIKLTASQKARILELETLKRLVETVPGYNAETRFIPYIEMHEFEALLFSDVTALSTVTGIAQTEFDEILSQYPNPEEINDDPSKAPSKQLIALKPNYKKTTNGNSIANAIGLEKMRSQCPHFNEWITRIESLSSLH